MDAPAYHISTHIFSTRHTKTSVYMYQANRDYAFRGTLCIMYLWPYPHRSKGSRCFAHRTPQSIRAPWRRLGNRGGVTHVRGYRNSSGAELSFSSHENNHEQTISTNHHDIPPRHHRHRHRRHTHTVHLDTTLTPLYVIYVVSALVAALPLHVDDLRRQRDNNNNDPTRQGLPRSTNTITSRELFDYRPHQ